MTNHSFAFPCLSSGSGSLRNSQQSVGSNESGESFESFESVVAKLATSATPDLQSELGLPLVDDGSVAADSVTEVATNSVAGSESNLDQLKTADPLTVDETLSGSFSDAPITSGVVNAIGNPFELPPFRIRESQVESGTVDHTFDGTTQSDVAMESPTLSPSSLAVNVQLPAPSETIEGELASDMDGDVPDDSKTALGLSTNGLLSEVPSVGGEQEFEDAAQPSSQHLSFGSGEVSDQFNAAETQIVSAGIGSAGIESTGIESTGIESTGIESTGIESTGIESAGNSEGPQAGSSEALVSASTSVVAVTNSPSGSTSVSVDSGNRSAPAASAARSGDSPGSQSISGERLVQDSIVKPNVNGPGISQINNPIAGESVRTAGRTVGPDTRAEATEVPVSGLEGQDPSDAQRQPALAVPSSDVVVKSNEAVAVMSQSGIAVAAANVAGGKRGQDAVSFDETKTSPSDGTAVGSVNAGASGDEVSRAETSGVDTAKGPASASTSPTEAGSEVAVTSSSSRQVEESPDEPRERSQSSTEGVRPELVADTEAARESTEIAIGDLIDGVDLDALAARGQTADPAGISSQSESPHLLTMDGRIAQDQYLQIQASSDAQVVETLSLEEFLRDMSSPVAVKKTSEVIGEAMASSMRLDGKTVELELHPADLGMLKIQVTQNEHSIEAQIMTSEFSTSELLLGQRDQLMDALADLGFDTSDVNIFHDEQSSGESKQQSSSDEFSFQTKSKASVPTNRNSVSSGGVNIVA